MLGVFLDLLGLLARIGRSQQPPGATDEDRLAREAAIEDDDAEAEEEGD